jgi:two-component system sensor histidine kinase UhpB
MSSADADSPLAARPRSRGASTGGIDAETAALEALAAELAQADCDALAAVDRERERFARDLHDNLSQYVTGMVMLAQALERRLSGRSAPEAADARRLTQVADRAAAHARRLANVACGDLWVDSPPAVALAAAIERVARPPELVCRLHCESFEAPLDREVGLPLLRIAEEALETAADRRRSTRIDVRWTSEADRRILEVIDDGAIGWDSPEASIAMSRRLMRRRADRIGASLDFNRNDRWTLRCLCPGSANEGETREP